MNDYGFVVAMSGTDALRKFYAGVDVYEDLDEARGELIAEQDVFRISVTVLKAQ